MLTLIPDLKFEDIHIGQFLNFTWRDDAYLVIDKTENTFTIFRFKTGSVYSLSSVMSLFFFPHPSPEKYN